MKLKICSSCQKECYLWKSSPKLCRECAMKSATQVGNYKLTTKSISSDIKPVEKRTPINKKSDKQKKIDAAYSVLRKQFMKDHPLCMFKNCISISTECHHIRGRGKDYMLDSREWMAVCKPHHDYIHANDKESRELGYLKSRLGK